ncbi:hypothetical protein HYALB_00004910 [Hymenoscyphus albidus]|uniref:Translation initiation factor 3 N-terminal domain-containing protein n=1 Tax=Hymenoscyphus albidus TaxID=595503 RepID=A0A9N9Q3E6_9HELO|nr:hypothetical protein HYALB_00004910 [Hymenoscyphus albidus]
MRSSRCIFSTASALRSVFIAPIEVTKPTPLLLTQKWQAFTPLPSHHQRAYAYMVTPKDAPTKSRLPRDQEIPYPYIRLVEDGILLEGSRRLTFVLSQLEPKTESLVMVVEPTDEEPYPICKIINKEAEYKRLKAAKKERARDPGKTTKTLELNWAIGRNDLAHRLEKMREFLRKGFKVEMVLVKKKAKGKPPISMGVMEGLVRRIREVFGEGGWREHKEMEGSVGGQVTLFVQGRLEKGEKGEKGVGKEKEVDSKEEGESVGEGESVVDGESAVKGESVVAGESVVEGERVIDGERVVEGENVGEVEEGK